MTLAVAFFLWLGVLWWWSAPPWGYGALAAGWAMATTLDRLDALEAQAREQRAELARLRQQIDPEPTAHTRATR